MNKLFTGLMGQAGSGKSHTIRKRLSQDPTYCLKTASTGIAAVNLQDENGSAITINSALGYFDEKDLLFKVAGGLLNDCLEKIAKKYQRIALDEASMISGATLSLIHRAIEDFNRSKGSQLGLMVIGDFAQLPPVNGNPVFMSKSWSEFHIEYLTEIKRQTDKGFIEALSWLRIGMPERALEYFESEVGFHKDIDTEYPGTTFFSKNKDVDEFNELQLSKLRSISRSYSSSRKGQIRTEWKNIPEVLELKEGSLVICLHNNPKSGYANGDLGKVVGLAQDYIEVELDRNGERVSIPYIEVDNKKFGYKVGSIIYLPVRLGWACTIHKAQGLTLDRVQAKLGDPFMSKTHGMGYVLMSRARTKEGIRLICSKEEFLRSFYFDPIYKNHIR
jgi:ATP-dependent DNA helicase PIF1